MVKQLMIIPLIMAMFFVPLAIAQEIPPPLTCNGLTATIVTDSDGSGINGTPDDDVIVGMNDEGNERINSGAGNDVICPGLGHNLITTRGDNNTIITAPGSTNAIYTQYGIGDTCYLQPGDFETGCETISYDAPENIEIAEITTQSVLTVSTDKPQYIPGETITISGTILPILENLSVTVQVTGEDQTIVHTDIISIVRLDGAYASQIVDNSLTVNQYTVTSTTSTGLIETTQFTIADPSVTIATDKPSYDANEPIVISGNAVPINVDIAIVVLIQDTTGRTIETLRTDQLADGTFSLIITQGIAKGGSYTAMIQTTEASGQTTFTVLDPIVTGTVDVVSLRMLDTTQQQVSQIETGQVYRLTFEVVNNQDQRFKGSAVVTIVDQPGIVTLLSSPATVSVNTEGVQTIGVKIEPLVSGTASVFLDVFDNSITPKSILSAPIPFTTEIIGDKVVVLAEPQVRIAELEAQVATLEAQIADHEARLRAAGL